MEGVQIRKDHLYIAIISVLALLLAASIASGGFGVLGSAAPSIRNAIAAQGIALDRFMDGGMRVGSDSAPIVMIEFSDFQCPSCRSFWQETLPDIEKHYIGTGKVQLIYRNYPLDFHPAARPAALAAECANEQGRWKEMHDMIFSQEAAKGQGTVSFGEADLKNWAHRIAGLDAAKFDGCLDSGRYNPAVDQDLQTGQQAGLSGTPSFLIGLRGSRGILVAGAQPYSAFQQILDELG